MFEHYQRIRIINLAEREDRRREMLGELRRVGLAEDARVAFFQAIRPLDQGKFRSIGGHGVYLSHLTLLQEAAKAGESLLILEDDCDFTKAIFAPRDRSDVLWGGYTIYPEHIEGAHCMGFSAAAVPRIATYLEDLLAEKPIEVDGAYIWFCRDHPDIITDACNPPIAVQRPSSSDISMQDARYAKVPQALLTLARSIKRVLKRRSVSVGSFESLVQRLRSAQAGKKA